MKLYDANGIQKITSVTAGRSLRYFKQAGTNPNECWYLAGAIGSGVALTTGAPAVDVLHAIPFMAPRTGTIDALGIAVSTLAVLGKAKILIYNNTSDTVMYPSSLFAASAEFDTSTTGAKKDTSVSISIVKDTMYWFVYWTGTLAATIRSSAVAVMCSEFLGYDSSLTATAGSLGLQVATAYSSGSNPSTYPASATFLTAVPIPSMFYRFST